MEAIPREILVCQNDDGREPFTEWLAGLGPKIEATVFSRIDRVEDGNLGDVEPVGEGVCELRIDFGPGYRIYIGQIGTQVHLIGGGTKKDQQRDIDAARRFWREHD